MQTHKKIAIHNSKTDILFRNIFELENKVLNGSNIHRQKAISFGPAVTMPTLL